MSYPQEVRDPIYGFIKYNEWEEKIINHRYFQRLRRISQNSLAEMVYPGLSHSRFEHSLGVFHLAAKMFESIINDKKSKDRLKERGYYLGDIRRIKQLIKITALLHDVGQPPFSHALEGETLMHTKPNTKEPYTHEDYTSNIMERTFRRILENPIVGINSKLVRDFFVGGPIQKLKGISFWKRLINGQLDADRGDYLLRDSYHAGVKYGVYDLDRVLETLGVGVYPEDDTLRFGIKEEGWQVAEAFVIARYKIFSQVYLHKTRRAFDIMLKKAVHRAFELNDEKGLKFPPPSKLKDYLKLDDVKIWNLMEVTQENNEWFRRLRDRCHIRRLRGFDPEKDTKLLKDVKDRLRAEKIWFHEDDLEESWYKEKQGEEILLIDEKGRMYPLSQKSKIVGKLDPFQRIRIYVKPEERKKAENIMEEVER